jgi:hypothetical protein
MPRSAQNRRTAKLFDYWLFMLQLPFMKQVASFSLQATYTHCKRDFPSAGGGGGDEAGVAAVRAYRDGEVRRLHHEKALAAATAERAAAERDSWRLQFAEAREALEALRAERGAGARPEVAHRCARSIPVHHCPASTQGQWA